MSKEEQWERLMHSIRRACHILNREVSRIDYWNWNVAKAEHEALWALVYTKGGRHNGRR